MLVFFAACLLSACETTSDFYEVAQRESDCSVKLTFYRHTLEHALASDESDYLNKAIRGIKATAPSCSGNPEDTVMDLTADVYLLNAHNRWQQSSELTALAISMIERHPELAINAVYFGDSSDFAQSAAHANNSALRQRVSAIEARMSGKSASELQARTDRSMELSHQSFDAYGNSGSDPTTQMVSTIGNAALAAAQAHAYSQPQQANTAAAQRNVAVASAASSISNSGNSASVAPVTAVAPGEANTGKAGGSGWQPGQDASKCVTVESRDRVDGPEAYIRNSCNQTINIAFCIVREDNPYDTSGRLLCSRGGGRETQLDAGTTGWISHETKHDSAITIAAVACVHPATPRNVVFGHPIKYKCLRAPY
ncbi:MAG: hypothetical protein AAGC84_08400 [Pseudomonas sp.]